MPYAAASREFQQAMRQRNAQLLAVKNGASAAALDTWDAQFARTAADLGRRRRDLVGELAAEFAETAAALAPDRNAFTLRLGTQLAALDFDDEALLAALRERRPGEIRRGLSLFGPHRDDLFFLEVAPGAAAAEQDPAGPSAEAGAGAPIVSLSGPACGPVDLPAGGRDLRLFGSQGEQRAAVLALLLAEQRLAAARTGEKGTLFLDDVMSELDDARRRLLVRMLASAGQAIITTTNRQYFTEDELKDATVIALPLSGSLAAAEAVPPADAAGPAPPAVDAL
jgi:DNA replication and repair protein RecF